MIEKKNITYFLGTHQPGWLAKTRVPLFVSYTRLNHYKILPKSRSKWALDSGAFSELHKHGKWTVTPSEYADGVRRLNERVGQLQWASIQDWLCTPAVIQRTGLSIKIHQKKTIESLCRLRSLAPEIDWLPVLQGWSTKSYFDHMKMYRAQGFELEHEALVGVGSVAVRQDSAILPEVLGALHQEGFRIHAFGLSITGLMRVHQFIESSDSMVWSFTARRRQIKHKQCNEHHDICNNCLRYALAWRSDLLSQLN